MATDQVNALALAYGAFPILAQSNPAATTLTDVYTVPANTSAIISNIFVCNQNASSKYFRLAIAIAGAANATKQYFYHGTVVGTVDTLQMETFKPLLLDETDVIRIYCENEFFSIQVLGLEVPSA